MEKIVATKIGMIFHKITTDPITAIGGLVDHEMELDDKTRLKFQQTFESNELKLELQFQSEKELSQQVEKIFKALQSGSVEKLIRIFQSIG